ncbi:hypothetical protein OsI_06461 [Oryza sativa Indica Group]|uniref:Uncharacterized protein n=1 Tax=Oryza sativa subsp. indica TaxID=39946 RepID=B8AEJ7_ORYSI|nr:hypothetical protein OsI_06461 [Oryza sativa Indica Group]
MTLERHRCCPGQGQAGVSPAVHHLPIYHKCTVAPPPFKPTSMCGHHRIGAPRRPVFTCAALLGSASTSLTSRCAATAHQPASSPSSHPTAAGHSAVLAAIVVPSIVIVLATGQARAAVTPAIVASRASAAVTASMRPR